MAGQFCDMEKIRSCDGKKIRIGAPFHTPHMVFSIKDRQVLFPHCSILFRGCQIICVKPLFLLLIFYLSLSLGGSPVFLETLPKMANLVKTGASGFCQPALRFPATLWPLLTAGFPSGTDKALYPGSSKNTGSTLTCLCWAFRQACQRQVLGMCRSHITKDPSLPGHSRYFLAVFKGAPCFSSSQATTCKAGPTPHIHKIRPFFSPAPPATANLPAHPRVSRFEGQMWKSGRDVFPATLSVKTSVGFPT